MNYSCVIATRNRLEALKLSIPMLLGQTRPPQDIIVVDSSDDEAAVRSLVEEFAAAAPLPVRYIRSGPGAAAQRNLGLRHVTGEVVLFPDDDSLLYPDAMDHIMRVYERDTEGLIGGVCAAEAHAPHESAGIAGASDRPGYRRRRSDAMSLALLPLRRRMEDRLIPDPFLTLAAQKLARLRQPDWLEEVQAIHVPYMTGFRMSFRTEVIRALQFDEGLGRYALFEDIDASLRTLDNFCVVAATQAFIYHLKAPERRDAGRAMGVMHILNRAYVLAKDRSDNPREWARIQSEARRFAGYKTLLYRLRAKSTFARDRLRGAELASADQQKLFNAPRHELAATYARVKEFCLRSPVRESSGPQATSTS